jgi:sulfur carrier protein
METTLEIVVNGKPVRLPSGASVADVLRHLLAPATADAIDETAVPGGIAVALGDEVVPASRWAATPVRHGDRLEVLGAVAGG